MDRVTTSTAIDASSTLMMPAMQAGGEQDEGELAALREHRARARTDSS